MCQNCYYLDLRNWEITCEGNFTSWRIGSVLGLDTGLDAEMGGRISQSMLQLPNERVLVTYGDGLANVNITTMDFGNQWTL